MTAKEILPLFSALVIKCVSHSTIICSICSALALGSVHLMKTAPEPETSFKELKNAFVCDFL